MVSTPGVAQVSDGWRAVGAVEVAAPDAGLQAVVGAVGQGDGFGFVLEAQDAEHGAEDFFLRDAHVGPHLVEHDFLEALASGRIGDAVLDVTDLPDIQVERVKHFFTHYKDLEPGKWAKIEHIGNVEDARRVILESIERAKADKTA